MRLRCHACGRYLPGNAAPNRKFCNDTCRRRFYSKQGKTQFKPFYRKCRFCKQPFLIEKHTKTCQRYCSPECREKALNMRTIGKPEWEPYERPCRECGKPILITDRRRQPKVHPECRRVRELRQNAEWRKRKAYNKPKSVQSNVRKSLKTRSGEIVVRNGKKQRCARCGGYIRVYYDMDNCKHENWRFCQQCKAQNDHIESNMTEFDTIYMPQVNVGELWGI